MFFLKDPYTGKHSKQGRSSGGGFGRMGGYQELPGLTLHLPLLFHLYPFIAGKGRDIPNPLRFNDY